MEQVSFAESSLRRMHHPESKASLHYCPYIASTKKKTDGFELQRELAKPRSVCKTRSCKVILCTGTKSRILWLVHFFNKKHVNKRFLESYIEYSELIQIAKLFSKLFFSFGDINSQSAIITDSKLLASF